MSSLKKVVKCLFPRLLGFHHGIEDGSSLCKAVPRSNAGAGQESPKSTDPCVRCPAPPRVPRLSFLPFTFLADIVPLGSLLGGFHFWAGDHSGNGTGRPAR